MIKPVICRHGASKHYCQACADGLPAGIQAFPPADSRCHACQEICGSYLDITEENNELRAEVERLRAEVVRLGGLPPDMRKPGEG